MPVVFGFSLYGSSGRDEQLLRKPEVLNLMLISSSSIVHVLLSTLAMVCVCRSETTWEFYYNVTQVLNCVTKNDLEFLQLLTFQLPLAEDGLYAIPVCLVCFSS